MHIIIKFQELLGIVYKSNYRNKSIVYNVKIAIPVPNDLKNPIFKTAKGIVSYFPDKEVILLNIFLDKLKFI